MKRKASPLSYPEYSRGFQRPKLWIFVVFLFLFCVDYVTAEWYAVNPPNGGQYYNFVASQWISGTTCLAGGNTALGGILVYSTNKGMSYSIATVDTDLGGVYALSCATIGGQLKCIVGDDLGNVYFSSTGTSFVTTGNFPMVIIGASIGSNGNAFIAGTGDSVYMSTDYATNYEINSWITLTVPTNFPTTWNDIR